MDKNLRHLELKIYHVNKKPIKGTAPEHKKKNRLPAVREFVNFAKP